MRLLAAVAVGLTLVSVEAVAQNSETSKKCTSLARDPGEGYPAKNYGVALENIDVAKALPACLAAVAAPDATPYDHYHLSRVYDRDGEATKRMAELQIAASDQSLLTTTPFITTKLGVAYYLGDDVPKDLNKAKKLFKAGSYRGDREAMAMLGIMAWNGEGGSVDRQEALRQTNNAAMMGYEPALKNLEIIQKAMGINPNEGSESASVDNSGGSLSDPPADVMKGIVLLLGAAAALKAEQPASTSSDADDDGTAIEENRRHEAEMQEITRRGNCLNSQTLGDDLGLALNGC